MAQVIRCPKCGGKNYDYETVCSKCGTPLRLAEEIKAEIERMLITTTPTVEGCPIQEYLGVLADAARVLYRGELVVNAIRQKQVSAKSKRRCHFGSAFFASERAFCYNTRMVNHSQHGALVSNAANRSG